MSFFTDDFKLPSAGSEFFKPADGENRIRVLDDSTQGWSYWNTQGKCLRYLERPLQEPTDVGIDKYGNPQNLKPIVVIPVWNYATSRVEIWEVTQVTIMKGLHSNFKDPDYGHPRLYDTKVIRGIGANKKVEYEVKPSPPKPAPPEAIAAYEASDVKEKIKKLFTPANQPVAAGMTKEELDQIDF